MDITVNIAQEKHINSRKWKWAHVLTAFVPESHLKRLDRFVLDKVTELRLMLFEISRPSSIKARKKRHAPIPVYQVSKYRRNAQFAIETRKHYLYLARSGHLTLFLDCCGHLALFLDSCSLRLLR